MEVRPGYKQTGIGVLPSDWDVVPIGKIAHFASGKGISVAALHAMSSDFPIPVYGGNGIAGYTEVPLVDNLCVVIGRVGQKCGEVYLTDGPAWITDNALYPVSVFRNLDVQFFALALKAAGLNSVKNRNDLPLVTQSILADVRIGWPSVEEQRAIATTLSDVNALLLKLDQLIAKKRNVRQAALQQLLTGQLRLPGQKSEWELASLDQIVVRATGFWGANDCDEDHPRFVEVIRAGDISKEGLLTATASRFFSEVEFSKSNCQLDDLVITTSGNGLGKVWWCDGRANVVASNFVRILHPIESRVQGKFLSYVLRSGEAARQLQEHTATSAYPNLRPSFFSTRWIPLPPVPEQTAIATVLSDMDSEIALLEARRDKTRAIWQGMFQALLTGKIRLV